MLTVGVKLDGCADFQTETTVFHDLLGDAAELGLDDLRQILPRNLELIDCSNHSASTFSKAPVNTPADNAKAKYNQVRLTVHYIHYTT